MLSPRQSGAISISQGSVLRGKDNYFEAKPVSEECLSLGLLDAHRSHEATYTHTFENSPAARRATLGSEPLLRIYAPPALAITKDDRSMETLSDVVLDWKLECDVRSDCTLQTRHVTNSAEGLWRERVEERWQRAKELGRGSFGVVWLEKCASGPSSGQLRAVKELRKSQASAKSKYYSKELEAIVKFSHRRVGLSHGNGASIFIESWLTHIKYQDCFVQSFGWFEDESAIFITMEYVRLGDLEHHLRTPLPEAQARVITRQVLQGLVFMHENKFAHRDLKPGVSRASYLVYIRCLSLLIF